ncbi:hypothetical protein ACLB1S_18310 [Escherichia coli]
MLTEKEIIRRFIPDEKIELELFRLKSSSTPSVIITVPERLTGLSLR